VDARGFAGGYQSVTAQAALLFSLRERNRELPCLEDAAE
jgi:hypothetical protein